MQKNDSKSYQVRVGKNLSVLMEGNNLAPATIAKKLSINRSTLHNWLNGTLPRGFMGFLKLANFFEVSLDELCYGDPNAPKQEKQQNEIKLIITLLKPGEERPPKLPS